MEFTPTQVDDVKDRAMIVDAEKRMGIREDRPIEVQGRSYTIRRNAGEMVWAVFGDGFGPVGYLAATYSSTRAMKLQVWDSRGREFAYGEPGRLVHLNKGLARLHDYLVETGR